MFAYPVKLTADKKDGGYVVTFPDIPEAITQGETKGEAMRMAREALETALDFYFDEARPVPLPSVAKRGQETVVLPASIAVKILLLNEMVKQDVRPAELARRLRTSPQAVNRLVNIRYTTKIDGIARALEALGKKLDIKVA